MNELKQAMRSGKSSNNTTKTEELAPVVIYKRHLQFSHMVDLIIHHNKNMDFKEIGLL